MTKISRYSLISILLFTGLFAGNLVFKKNNIDLDKKTLTIDSKNSLDILEKITEGNLPISSTFYQIDENHDFEASVTYEVSSSVYIENINQDAFVQAGYDIANNSKFCLG